MPKFTLNAKLTERLGRLGLFAKGLIYALIGIFSAMAAMRLRKGYEDSKGVLIEVATAPLGQVLIVGLFLGFCSYGSWRFLQGFNSPKQDQKKYVKRLLRVFDGSFSFFLAYTAFKIFVFSEFPKPDPEEEWVQWVLTHDFGTYLVMLIGAAIIGAGFFQIFKIYRAKIKTQLDRRGLNHSQAQWIIGLSRLGFAARAISFFLVGLFCISAGLHSNSNEAMNLKEAFSYIAHQPFGRPMVILMALGFLAYSAYCFARSFYNKRHTFVDV